jgi:SAM-dependent methyltransferase
MQAPEGRARAQLVYVSKSIGRRLRWAPQDLRERSGRGALVPPRGLSFVGGGDFVRVGREHLDLFTEHGGLKPGDRVLDVGCGIGRMAVPLLDYLDADGSYAGFDVGKAMIDWCRKNITARRADFEFTWAPIYNRKYNPFGTIAADEFRFPYEDDSFDFIFATSLFTHLTLADARHYLAEVGRVLAPGGRCYLTFFVLADHARAELDAGRAAFDFRFPVERGLTIDRHEPEAAIAFEEPALRDLFAAADLQIDDPIRYGHWAHAPAAFSGQDVVLARNPD